MKLNTGKVAFLIEFDNGDKDNIYFNPNDMDLPMRLRDFQNNVSAKLKECDDINISNDGEPESTAMLDAFQKIRDIMCNELDAAFGGEVSKVVFKHCSPFAVVGGEYFIVQFLNAIRPEIEKHIKKATADLQKKMAKHTNKYAK